MAATAVTTRQRFSSGIFVLGAVFAAAVVGVAAAWDPKLGVAACVALVAVPTAIVKPHWVPHLLMISVFSASLEVGGTVTVGRAVAPLGVLAVIVYVLQHPVKLRHSGLLIGVAVAYAVLAFASLWWSVAPEATFDSLITLGTSIGYGATFAILVRNERDLHSLMWVAVFSSVALAILWIGSYAAGVDRRFNEAGDPNFFAALQVATLPLVLALASTSKSQIHKLLLGLAVTIIAGSIISTLSVGGVLTLGVAVLVVFLLPANNMFRSRSQKATYLVAALLGLIGLFVVAQEDVLRRLDTKLGARGDIGDSRQDLWKAAMRGYEERPLTGLGFGGFYASSFQLLRTTPGVDIQSHLRFVGVGEFVHNAYIGSLAELGPLGLVAFVGMLLLAVRTLRRAARRAELNGDQFKRKAANAVLVGVVAFSVSSFLLSTETSRMLWMLLGLTVAIAKMTEANGRLAAR